MTTLIDYRLDGEVALIGLARPPVNALGQPLREALAEAFERAIGDSQVRAVVIYGQGRAFSAGADISEFGSPAAFAAPDLASLLSRLAESPKPLIAAIAGTALGAVWKQRWRVVIASALRMPPWGCRKPGSGYCLVREVLNACRV